MDAELRGEFWFHDDVFKPQIGGSFTEAVNVYPNHTLFTRRRDTFLTDTPRRTGVSGKQTVAVENRPFRSVPMHATQRWKLDR